MARDLSYAINKMNNKKQMREVWKQMKSKVKEREKRTGKTKYYRLKHMVDNYSYYNIPRCRFDNRYSSLSYLYKGFNGKAEIVKFEEQGLSMRNIGDLKKFRWAERKAEEAKYVGLDALMVGTNLCEDVIGVIMEYL